MEVMLFFGFLLAHIWEIYMLTYERGLIERKNICIDLNLLWKAQTTPLPKNNITKYWK